ncbi:MAG TPA: phosphoribosylamine--glycine ligase [Gemmatimonadales bacterium]|nr:phosphoribosylamine--glycine ligase [Gemmatimonadales bacterium]
MRLLVVGGGGREHALCWALRRENPEAEIYCAPGNPGTAEVAQNLPIAADDLDRLADGADMHGIDLTIVGPEAPLARGLADRLRAEGRAVFGPSAAAAQLEASKAFAKEVMASAGVRTAASRSFTDLAAGLSYVDRHAEPLVVKASGLAAGKGAIVCATRAEAARAVRAMLEADQFGEAGRTVVIESFLQGEEISVMVVTDGEEVELLPVAQDHKRLLEGDQGPNTGGMGAYSPVSLGSPALLERVKRDVMLPTLEGMRRAGAPFSGVLYAGLMIDPAGVPWVVEFNCRLGDPEAQVILPLISEGLTDALWKTAKGEAPSRIDHSRGAAVTTVLAARGYPDRPEKGAPIRLPDAVPEGVTMFHAGTSRGRDGVLRVDGGRVLTATAVGTSFSEAQQLSREAAEAVQYEGKVFRRDIGWREAARLDSTRSHDVSRSIFT